LAWTVIGADLIIETVFFLADSSVRGAIASP